MRVFVSHTGIDGWGCNADVSASTLKGIVTELNNSGDFNRIFNIVFDNGHVSSSTRVFCNVDVVEEHNNTSIKFYEKEDTKEIKHIDEDISSFDNVLISVFNAESLISLLDKTVNNKVTKFQYVNEDGKTKESDIKPMIQNIDFQVDAKVQTLYEFLEGEASLESLKYSKNEVPYIEYAQDGAIIKEKSKLLPEDLIDAIRDMWGLDDGMGRLRLFQEDSLFFISERLHGFREVLERQLLLSMPTGGGKTEAFMIPLIASIYEKKRKEKSERVRSIVIYPTKALANDQAMRFVELIYGVNKQLVKAGTSTENLISIGVLSGDTPSRNKDLAKESLIKICPKCGGTHWDRNGDNLVCKNPDCGASLSFCRLTRESIIDNPPDILITNPDEINSCLHNASRASIFYSKIDSIVFDEVHVYQGIFGCHVAHLLRRMEEVSGHKPLYIGMSATIKNAKELAALLFNEPLEGIKYINDKEHAYTDREKPVKQRLHVLLKPALISSKGDSKKYVRSMSVAGIVGMFIGHLISDSHFRKSIIFTNYRSEADDLASYVGQRERLDVDLMLSRIMNKYKTNQPLTDEEFEICQFMLKWFEGIEKAVGKIAPSMTIGWNRGGLEKETRIRSIHSFSRNTKIDDVEKYPIDLMIATKSLEVGIDIGDVTTVVNASAPFTANEYVQRVGRGGRKNDSLAVTVINSENAIDAYFKMHFSEYVEAKDDIYEEAPIILNNDIIIRRHIEARLLDYFVKTLVISGNTSWYITCKDVIEGIKIDYQGKTVSLGQGKTESDVRNYVDALYYYIFQKKIDGIEVFDRFVQFLKNETEILGTKLYDISENEIKEILYKLSSELNSKIQVNAKNKWEMSERLIGYDGYWAKYSPNLRGNGASVSLRVKDINDDEVDVVSRQVAFNQLPPAMNEKQVITTHSGISTFKVDGIYKDTDGETEKKIKRILRQKQHIRDYFDGKIDGFPSPDDPEDFPDEFKVTVPNALNVSYFPSRFYCPKCKKGLVSGTDFNEVRKDKHGNYCYKCGSRVEQLHQVIFCGDCGGVFDPPVAKICFNPDCSDYKKFFAAYISNNKRYTQDMISHFKFRLTKDSEWECATCGCKMNFYSNKNMQIHNRKRFNFVNKVVQQWTESDTIDGLAVRIKKHPEFFRESTNKRNLDSVFTCKNNHSHKPVKVIGIPRVRTVSYSYIGNKSDDDLCASISNDICSITFREGYVLQLATQFMRRYTSGSYGDQVNRIHMDDIFDYSQGFNSLGNYYESHLAWIKVGDKLDEFIRLKKYSCNGDCANCEKFTPDKLDLGESMKPKVELEEYNYDQTTGTIKKPDFRGKFCKKALSGECNELRCSGCKDFDGNAYLRYLIIHTLKHSILWAMPKYAGVNIGDLKGEIYPNDGQDDCDIVLVDNNEGGSGAIVLVQRHWNEIWNFSREIVELTTKNEANLLLNHNCFRNNADLCPYITSEFFEYIDL